MWNVVQVLTAIAIFYLGAFFGAWLVSSNQKRVEKAQAVPLMELADDAG